MLRLGSITKLHKPPFKVTYSTYQPVKTGRIYAYACTDIMFIRYKSYFCALIQENEQRSETPGACVGC